MKNLPLIKSQNINKILTSKVSAKIRSLSLKRMSDHRKDKKAGESALKDAGWFALKTAAISGAVLGGTAVALPALGFTSVGVAGGSLAALYQSTFLGGTIASGSAFAVLQSVGAAGLAASTQAAVVLASATASGAHTVLKKIKKRKETDPENTAEEPSESNMEDDVVDEEAMEKIDDKDVVAGAEKNKDSPGLDARSSQNTGAGKGKEYPVKFAKKYKKDDATSDSLELKDDTYKNECVDEMDLLRAKWEDVELSKDLTITHELMKKGKLK